MVAELAIAKVEEGAASKAAEEGIAKATSEEDARFKAKAEEEGAAAVETAKAEEGAARPAKEEAKAKAEAEEAARHGDVEKRLEERIQKGKMKMGREKRTEEEEEKSQKERRKEEFHPGDKVQIHGLQGAVHFNGRSAILESFIDSLQRWEVQLEDGAKFSVKPQNIALQD